MALRSDGVNTPGPVTDTNWMWGYSQNGERLGPDGQPTDGYGLDPNTGAPYTGGSTPSLNNTFSKLGSKGGGLGAGLGIGALLSGLLGGGGQRPTVPMQSAQPIAPPASPTVTAPAPPAMPASEPKRAGGNYGGGVSPALRGVLTGEGGTSETSTIDQLLAQLLKRPRVGV